MLKTRCCKQRVFTIQFQKLQINVQKLHFQQNLDILHYNKGVIAGATKWSKAKCL